MLGSRLLPNGPTSPVASQFGGECGELPTCLERPTCCLMAEAGGAIASMGGTANRATPLWWLDPTQGILLGAATFAAGTSPPAVTFGGTRTFAKDVRVFITSVAGGTGLGQALFGYSVNGVTIQTGLATVASHAAIGPIAGMTINFPAGPYAANNTWRGQVESWTDRTGGFVFTQGTAANRPFYEYAAVTLNGQPGLDFDGSNDSLVCTTAGAWNWLSGAGKTHAYTLFYQAAFDIALASNFVVSYANTASTTGFWAWGITNSGTGAWFMSLNDGAAKNLTSALPDFTPAALFEASSSGTSAGMKVTGYDSIPATANNQNPGTVTLNNAAIGIRNRSGADGPMNGVVGHVVQFSSQLTEQQALLWRNFLKMPTGMNTVLQSSRIVLTGDVNRAGAGFVAMGLNGGGNLINATDHGRGVQCSASINRDTAPTGSQSYNPTEQGSQANGAAANASSSQRLLGRDALGLAYLRTVTRPAYWLAPGDPGALNTTIVSDWAFDLETEANAFGDASIVRWTLLTTLGALVTSLPITPNQVTIESVTVYLTKTNFDTVERYNPSTSTLTTITPAQMDPAGPLPGPTFFPEPVIVSNAVGTDRAVMLYTIDPSPGGRGFSVTDFSIGGGAPIFRPDFQWNRYGALAGGEQFLIRNFLLGGTKAQCLAAADGLYARFGVY